MVIELLIIKVITGAYAAHPCQLSFRIQFWNLKVELDKVCNLESSENVTVIENCSFVLLAGEKSTQLWILKSGIILQKSDIIYWQDNQLLKGLKISIQVINSIKVEVFKE